MNTRPRFDPDIGEPDYLYRKLADHIAQLVEAGVSGWRPGDRLQHWTELALEFFIPHSTIDRAVGLLVQRGTIVHGSTGGLIINPDPHASWSPTQTVVPHLAWLALPPALADVAGWLVVHSHDKKHVPHTVDSWSLTGPDGIEAANDDLTARGWRRESDWHHTAGSGVEYVAFVTRNPT